MTFGHFRKVAAVAAAAFLASLAGFGPAGAQPGTAPAASAQPAPQGPNLNIPSNVSFVGNANETNIARATAVVNDEIITRTDVDQRLALLIASQPDVRIPPEEMENLRGRILRNLIDEALQIQAARTHDVAVEQRDVDRYYARFAQSFQHTPQTFGQYLRSIGASERTVKRQIEGELSWQRLQRRVLPRVSVADQEVQEVLNRLNASRGATEYHVAEIYLSATPENAATVRATATRLVQQIRSGASFPGYARQYSEATTAAAGGDLGWVQAAQLPAELAAVVQAMPVGTLSDPIPVQGGYSMILLVDSRQVLMPNPRDAQLSLMQMSISLPAGTTEAQARQRAQQLAAATQSMGGCGRAAETATAVGAELVSNDSMKVRDLPPQLQPAILQMSVGQATPPFGTPERISVLILCGRDDPQPVGAPNREQIATQMEEDRMNRQAQRYLRDLRRDAVIEYR